MDKAALQHLYDHQNYAIVGMSDNPERYSYKIFYKLLEKNKTVFGINPVYDEVEGHKMYAQLTDIDHPIDTVILLVNPSIGIQYLDDMKKLGIKTLWIQPGAKSQEIMDKAEALELHVIRDCVLALYNYEDY